MTTSRKRESKIGCETTRRQLTDPCQEKKTRFLLGPSVFAANYVLLSYRPRTFLANFRANLVPIDRRWNVIVANFSSRPRAYTRLLSSLSFAIGTIELRDRYEKSVKRERERDI